MKSGTDMMSLTMLELEQFGLLYASPSFERMVMVQILPIEEPGSYILERSDYSGEQYDDIYRLE